MTEEQELAQTIVDAKSDYERILTNYQDSHNGQSPPAGSSIMHTLNNLQGQANDAREHLRALGADDAADALEAGASSSSQAQQYVDTTNWSSGIDTSGPEMPAEYDPYAHLGGEEPGVGLGAGATISGTYNPITGGITQPDGTVVQAGTGVSPLSVLQALLAPFGAAFDAITGTIVAATSGTNAVVTTFFSLAVSWLPWAFVAWFSIKALDLDVALKAGPLKADIGR